MESALGLLRLFGPHLHKGSPNEVAASLAAQQIQVRLLFLIYLNKPLQRSHCNSVSKSSSFRVTVDVLSYILWSKQTWTVRLNLKHAYLTDSSGGAWSHSIG